MSGHLYVIDREEERERKKGMDKKNKKWSRIGLLPMWQTDRTALTYKDGTRGPVRPFFFLLSHAWSLTERIRGHMRGHLSRPTVNALNGSHPFLRFKPMPFRLVHSSHP